MGCNIVFHQMSKVNAINVYKPNALFVMKTTPQYVNNVLQDTILIVLASAKVAPITVFNAVVKNV